MDIESAFRVDGMVAAITGGGSGIGLMMAKALASAGAKKVYLLGRRKDVLEEAAKIHTALSPLECDVTSKKSLQAAVDAIQADEGFVNLLVANSGTLGPPRRMVSSDMTVSEMRKHMFEEMEMEDFTQTFRTNVTGAYFTMLAFLELLDAGNKNAMKGGFGAPLKQGNNYPSIQSQILVSASIAGFSRAHWTSPAYGSSKAAMIHLTKHASTNLALYGIRVNALAPGLFPSELAAGLIGERNPDDETWEHPKFIPAGRFGGELEMGGTVVYLAGRGGAFNNGLILLGDGGRVGQMSTSY